MTQPRPQFKVLFPLLSDWLQSGAREKYLGELTPAVKHFVEERSGCLEVVYINSQAVEQDIGAYHRLVTLHQPNAIIIPRLSEGGDSLLTLKELGIPFVLFGSDNQHRGFHWVDTDNFGAMRLAVLKATKLGHARIAFLNGSETLSYGRQRLSGFKAGMNQAEIELDDSLVLSGHPIHSQGLAMTQYLLQQKNPPSCIICATDELAMGACEAITRQGLKVGSSISVIGYGNSEAGQRAHPKLATIAFSYKELGEWLGLTAANLAQGLEKDFVKFRAPVSWQDGESLQPSAGRDRTLELTSSDIETLSLNAKLKQYQRVQSLAQVGSWYWYPELKKFRLSVELKRQLNLVTSDDLLSWEALIDLIAVEDRSKFEKAWAFARLGQEFDVEVRLSDELMPTYMRWFGDFTRDGNGNLVLAEGGAQNITQLVQSREELVLAKQKAEQADAFKSQFLANVTHELRTPLHAVLGLSHRLKTLGVGEEQQKILNQILSSGGQLSSTIDDLLLVTRAEVNAIEIDHHHFNLNQLLNDLKLTIQPLLLNDQISFKVAEVDPSINFLVGDDFRLKQVLTNLLGNAAKFTSQGSIELNVVVQSTLDQQPEVLELEFRVIDSGIGIPNNKLADLFEAFAQADSGVSRSYGGTGLGLSIVKHLVDLMGGRVDVESKPGEGSCFSVVLPFELSTHTQLEAYLANRQIASFRLEDLNVLVVDDSEINLELASGLLEDLGARVDKALSGQKALAALYELNGVVDVILMDLQMPNMDGFETASIIKEQRQFKHIPIIAVSAGVTEEQQRRTSDVGMVGFLPKPFTADQLASEILRVTSYADSSALLEDVSVSLETLDWTAATPFDYEKGQTFWSHSEAYNQQLQKFVGRYQDPTSVNQLIKTSTVSDLKGYLHKLRGISSILGLTQLSIFCTYYEQKILAQGVEGDTTEYLSVGEEYQQIMERTLSQLYAFLGIEELETQSNESSQDQSPVDLTALIEALETFEPDLIESRLAEVEQGLDSAVRVEVRRLIESYRYQDAINRLSKP